MIEKIKKDPVSFEIWIFRNGQPDCDGDCIIFVAMTYYSGNDAFIVPHDTNLASHRAIVGVLLPSCQSISVC
jgi:hypothetical protein